MARPSFTLSERTLIPVSFVVTIMGVVAWLVTMGVKVDMQQRDLDHMQEHSDESDKTTVKILQRLERMDAKLDLIYDKEVSRK